MKWKRKLVLWVRALFRNQELDADMDEEMRSHIEMQTQANMGAGMKPDEARCAALRQFGAAESIKETCRERRGALWLDQALHDLRYGWRTLRKSPGFTGVAVLTLTLGIGANSAVFSLVSAMLLRPLPYPASDQLVQVQKQVRYPWETKSTVIDYLAASELSDWRRESQDVIELAPYGGGEVNLSGAGEAERVDCGAIGDSFLPVLGVQPMLGRNFLPEEDRPGGSPVALLSHGLWARRFGADPGVLGKTVGLDGKPFTVVGVLPPDFRFHEHYDLMAKSFVSLLGVNLGFRPDKILCLTISLGTSKYPDARSQAAYFQQVIERLRTLPGVQTVGASVSPPLSHSGMSAIGVEVEGHPPLDGKLEFMQYDVVNPDYFRALSIPLLSGRALSEQDQEGAQRVAVVNESFARHYFLKEDPLGRRIKWSGDQQLTIVGVVGDVRHSLSLAPQPKVYLSYLQSGFMRMSLTLRTTGEPMALAAAVRAQIKSVDRDQPAFRMLTLEQQLQDSLAPHRATLMLFGAFSVSALLLALVGIYGVVAYSISLRTQEIGIRMALGGQRADILRLVLGQGLGMIIGGVVLGLAGALALTRFLASQLFNLSPNDPVTFTEVTLVLAGAALVACLRPVLQATRVDPMTALRYE